MSVIRNEFRTGLLALLSLIAVVTLVIFLSAPGLLREKRVYRIYFDNANGISVGAPVMLDGRRIGQVSNLISPVPDSERPQPNLAVIVEVMVEPGAKVYHQQNVRMTQYSLLGEEVIDFTKGEESSGIASTGSVFIGERQPGLCDVGQRVLDKLEPVVGSASVAMQDLQKTCAHLTKITEEGSDMVVAIANFRNLGERLMFLSGSNGVFQHTLENLEELTGDESPLAKALQNAEKFTDDLAKNTDIGASLHNFRRASENLSATAQGLRKSVRGITPGIDKTVHNAEQFTDTVKHQPWRLIWPTTKKYPEDNKPKPPLQPCSTPQAPPCRIPVSLTTKTR